MNTRPEVPYSLPAERMVLGSIMLDGECLDDLALMLRPEDFFRDAHGRLFAILLERHRAGEPVIYPEVHLHLDSRGLSGKVATLDELRACVDSIPSTVRAVEYAQEVLTLSRRRQQIQNATEFLAALHDMESDLDEISGVMSRRVEAIRTEGTRMRARPLGDIAHEAIDSMRSAATGDFLGLPSPWPELDKMTGGLQPGRLMVVAGRPGSGKSSAALNLVRSVAAAEFGVYVVSLEMSNHELGVRQLSSETALPGSQLLFAPDTLIGSQWAQLERAADDLTRLNVLIDETASKTIDQIADESRAYVRRNNVGLVVVDHVGLITPTRAQRNLTRQQFIGICTRQLKLMAKDLQIPVVALSQLNRNVEGREDKRPRLDDLRESGDVEQDADQILMIYRDPKTTDDNTAELILRKNRCGPCGTVQVVYDRPTTTFRTVAEYAAGTRNGTPF